MTEDEMSNNIRLSSTSLLAFLTLLVTVIAAIPSFLSLNKEQAAIFFSAQTSHVSVPDSLDSKKALSILEANGIPGSTVELSIINQGNSEAKKIKFSIDVPGEIIAVWSNPSTKEKPIWVNLPVIQWDKESKTFQAEITHMGTTIPLTYYVGYLHSESGNPNVKVFHNGKPAEYVESISSVPLWSKWKVFMLPLYILGGGFGLVLFWAFVVALYKSPSFREKVIRELLEAAHPGYGPMGVSILIKEALKSFKEKKDL